MIQLTCPHCQTVNRVPPGRLADQPTCGACKKPLLSGVHALQSDTIEGVLQQSAMPVIVDFWAPWCGPCKMVAPTLEKIAKENAGKVIVAKVNTDENPQWAMKYGVQGIPTMLFVAGGKIVHRQVGALPEPVLRTIVTQFLEIAAQPVKN